MTDTNTTHDAGALPAVDTARKKYGRRNVAKMIRQVDEHRKMVRAEGTPAVQESWDAIEEHIDYAYGVDRDRLTVGDEAEITGLIADVARLTADCDRMRSFAERAAEIINSTVDERTQELMQERDVYGDQIEDLTARLEAMLARAEAAEAEVARLREVYWRLRSYASHDDGCKLNKPPRFSGPCSCGLADAIKGGAA